MSGGNQRSRPGGRRKSVLVALLLAALIPIAVALVSRTTGPGAPPAANDEDYRRELRSYVIGAALAFVLTAIPFGLVYWSVLTHGWLLVAIGLFALIQLIVHFRFFLHIDPPRQNMDDLRLILFSTLILLAMAGGTIWVLGNLAARMS